MRHFHLSYFSGIVTGLSVELMRELPLAALQRVENMQQCATVLDTSNLHKVMTVYPRAGRKARVRLHRRYFELCAEAHQGDPQYLCCWQAPEGQRMFVKGGTYRVHEVTEKQLGVIDALGHWRVINREALTFIARNDWPKESPKRAFFMLCN